LRRVLDRRAARRRLVVLPRARASPPRALTRASSRARRVASAPPAELKLELLVAAGDLVLDRERRALGNDEPLARHLDPERLPALERIGEPPKALDER